MQVVAGVNHHLIMSTVDSEGQGHRVHAIIHEDTSGDVPTQMEDLRSVLSALLSLSAGGHKLLSTSTESLQSADQAEQIGAQPSAPSSPSQDQAPRNDSSSWLWIVVLSCSLVAVVCFVAGVATAMLVMRRSSPATVTVKVRRA